MFVYRVEGEETLSRLLQNNVQSDGGMHVATSSLSNWCWITERGGESVIEK
jgi:hypothetical protein